jgi:enoyl-CoA hydratase/carnithine racemase
MDPGSDQLRASVAGGVGTIVFDNPEKHNALTAGMFAAVSRVCETFAADPEVRVVVLRGAGERAFVSGADIGQLDRGDLRHPAASEPGGAEPAAVDGEATGRDDAARAGLGGLFDLDKPVVALIHGYCIGGGVMVALAADVRICADDAQFAIPAAKLGVGYPHEATARLVALVGPGQASEILFGAGRFDAVEAARIGLVNRVVPKAGLDDVVGAFAAEVAANAPLSHVAHKRSIRAAMAALECSAGPDVGDAIAAAWRSDDFSEGAQAFFERRTPEFRGR